jgi:hypothetical protein
MDVDDVADELYCLPVKHFTETRNSRAKELSASGDSKTAASVRKLRKPSQAAWLANQLVRRHPKEIEEIIGLGKDLRQAQDQSKGADLRRLSSNRQELSQRVLRLAADEAKTAGVPFGTDVQRQLVATIEAAMATESSGVALKTGRLSEALSHVGFGGVESTESSEPKRKRHGSESRSESGSTRQSDLAEAEKAMAESQTALDVATKALAQAHQLHDSAISRRRDLAADLRKAERAVNETSKELGAAVTRQKRERAALRAAESVWRRRR